MSSAPGDVLRAANRLRSNQFKVLVICEFSRGKSAFINALLGQSLRRG